MRGDLIHHSQERVRIKWCSHLCPGHCPTLSGSPDRRVTGWRLSRGFTDAHDTAHLLVLQLAENLNVNPDNLATYITANAAVVIVEMIMIIVIVIEVIRGIVVAAAVPIVGVV